MGFFAIFLRRLLLALLLTAAGGIAWSWWRDQAAGDAPGPPEWPPLSPEPPPAANATSDSPAVSGSEPARSAGSQPVASAPEPSASATSVSNVPGSTAAEAAPSNSAASFVNALVDAPEARSRNGEVGGWTEPLDDGSCPISHPIKANDNSGIFHVPDGRFYARTNPERCYSDAAAATADGYRQAKH